MVILCDDSSPIIGPGSVVVRPRLADSLLGQLFLFLQVMSIVTWTNSPKSLIRLVSIPHCGGAELRGRVVPSYLCPTTSVDPCQHLIEQEYSILVRNYWDRTSIFIFLSRVCYLRLHYEGLCLTTNTHQHAYLYSTSLSNVY